MHLRDDWLLNTIRAALEVGYIGIVKDIATLFLRDCPEEEKQEALEMLLYASITAGMEAGAEGAPIILQAMEKHNRRNPLEIMEESN